MIETRHIQLRLKPPARVTIADVGARPLRMLLERGPQGPKGDRGERGERGERGADGADGLPGRDGRDGRDGLPGRDGQNAPQPQGARGAVQFHDGAGALGGDDFFTYDAAMRSFGLGLAAPLARAHIRARVGEDRDLLRLDDAGGRRLVRVTREGRLALGDDFSAVHTFTPQYPLDINDAGGMALRAGQGNLGLGWEIRPAGSAGSALSIKRMDAPQAVLFSPTTAGLMSLGGNQNFQISSAVGWIGLMPSEGGWWGDLFVGRRADFATTSGARVHIWTSNASNERALGVLSPGGLETRFGVWRDGAMATQWHDATRPGLSITRRHAGLVNAFELRQSDGALSFGLTGQGRLILSRALAAPVNPSAVAAWIEIETPDGARGFLPVFE